MSNQILENTLLRKSEELIAGRVLISLSTLRVILGSLNEDQKLNILREIGLERPSIEEIDLASNWAKEALAILEIPNKSLASIAKVYPCDVSNLLKASDKIRGGGRLSKLIDTLFDLLNKKLDIKSESRAS